MAMSAGRSAGFARRIFNSFVASREIDFFDRRAGKIEDEIQQRVHEQKAALFQGVNCGQLAGLNLADHALRPAFGQTSRELV